jgi:phosphohistidine phosphatase SixA
VLIIGHNPALSDCAVLLSGADRFAWLPTGALVGLAFDTDTWNDLDAEKGEVILTLFPRELEEE